MRGTFQRCINETLSQHSQYSLTNINDVLVYSSSWEEHQVHLRGALASLKEAGLTAKSIKCVWDANSFEYLGHKIGNGVVTVPDARVKSLRNYIRPTNQKGIGAFFEYYKLLLEVYSGLCQVGSSLE